MTGRLLVVEDDPDLCKLIAKYLTRIGYKTEQALTGEDAWALIEQANPPFSVFVIDLSLPGLTGADLARRLLNSQPGARILLTSGYPFDLSAICPPGSNVSFLLKPFPPGQLAEELSRVT